MNECGVPHLVTEFSAAPDESSCVAEVNQKESVTKILVFRQSQL